VPEIFEWGMGGHRKKNIVYTELYSPTCGSKKCIHSYTMKYNKQERKGNQRKSKKYVKISSF